MKKTSNVIDLEDIKLLKDAEKAIDGIDRILQEAMQHADNPEIQKFLEQMADKIEELSKEMQGLDDDLEELKGQENE